MLTLAGHAKLPLLKEHAQFRARKDSLFNRVQDGEVLEWVPPDSSDDEEEDEEPAQPEEATLTTRETRP